MLKSVFAFLVFITSILLILYFFDSPHPSLLNGRRVLADFSRDVKERYNLESTSIFEMMNKRKYSHLGISFSINRKLTKDEGRALAITLTKELLNRINADHGLQPFLNPLPFTIDNVSVSIMVVSPDVRHPDIMFFRMMGNLSFTSYYPEDRFKIHTNEVESFAEAQKLTEEWLKENTFEFIQKRS